MFSLQRCEHKWESKLNMDLLPPELHDVAILRRILFASVYVPKYMPDYWLAVTNFASQGGLSLQPQSVKITVENLKSINEKAFAQLASCMNCVLLPQIHVLLASF